VWPSRRLSRFLLCSMESRARCSSASTMTSMRSALAGWMRVVPFVSGAWLNYVLFRRLKYTPFMAMSVAILAMGNRRALRTLVAVERKPTTLSVSLYSFCASCYRHLPYRHSARQAAGPLIENLPYVLTGDREPVDLYLLAATGLRSSRSATTQRPTLQATAAPLTKAPSLRKTRRGLFSRGLLRLTCNFAWWRLDRARTRRDRG
jgi:hypothetical protein